MREISEWPTSYLYHKAGIYRLLHDIPQFLLTWALWLKVSYCDRMPVSLSVRPLNNISS